MIVFYLLLFILIISKIRFSRNNFHSDYLSFDTTNAIKGVFIALVFINHAAPYILNSGYVFEDTFWSKLFLFCKSFVGQWIVAMFLFYSGYGVMESIQKKGHSYVSSLPRNRILTTLINFDIAVCVFAILSLFIPNDYSIQEYILSFTGWESVGNSNWYIFVIMICYAITYLSFLNYNGTHLYMHTAAIGFITLCTILLLSYLKPSWWYDTMLCFPAGVFFSVFRLRIEPIVKRYYWSILCLLVILATCFLRIPYQMRGLTYNLFCVVFCMLIIMLSMKIKINNAILIWAGKNLFPLYIYQRVPMIIFSSIAGGSFVANFPVLYTTVCLFLTLLFAHLYKYWMIKL